MKIKWFGPQLEQREERRQAPYAAPMLISNTSSISRSALVASALLWLTREAEKIVSDAIRSAFEPTDKEIPRLLP